MPAHALLRKALRSHIREDWILLYLERWLIAPFETEDGARLLRERGTPQGGVISPIMMNLFMHYAFDRWMQRTSPNCPFAVTPTMQWFTAALGSKRNM